MSRTPLPKVYFYSRGGNYQENKSKHKSLVISLEEGLLALSEEDKPRVISVRENPEEAWNELTTRLYSYNIKGIIVASSRFTGIDWHYSTSTFEVQAFPSAVGLVLTAKLDELMQYLDFKKVRHEHPDYKGMIRRI